MTNPKEEMSCIAINIAYVKDWTIDVPMSKLLQDIHVCKECGETINTMINDTKERNRFITDGT